MDASDAKILEGLGRLAEIESFEALQPAMLAVVGSIVDSDHMSYNELDPEMGRAVSWFDDPAVDDLLRPRFPAFVRFMDQHPLLRHFRDRPGAPPQRISDFLSQPRLRDLGLYQEVFRPLRTEYQAVVNLSAPPGTTVGIALCRCRADFTDAEKTALARLQPFLQKRYAEARQRHLVQLLLSGRAEPPVLEALARLGLSAREAEACALMIQGLSNREIGETLGISALTAKTHCERLFAKLGASGRVQATRRAIEGLLQLPGIRNQGSEDGRSDP